MLCAYKVSLFSVPQTEFVVIAHVVQVNDSLSGDDQWIVHNIREVSVKDVEVLHFINDKVKHELEGAILQFENNSVLTYGSVTV